MQPQSSMITVSRGDWRKPTYVQINKEDFYAEMRKPLGESLSNDDDPTVQNLTKDSARAGTKSAEEIIRAIRRIEFESIGGMLRTGW